MSVDSPEQLRDRTKAFAIRIVCLFRALPSRRDAQVIGTQLLRSGTSVGANYRAACRSRSRAEFISRLGVVVEEADERVFWLELLGDTQIISQARLRDLLQEANELTAIFSATRRTTRSLARPEITNHKSQITNG
jgi:four helix bundle protein